MQSLGIIGPSARGLKPSRLPVAVNQAPSKIREGIIEALNGYHLYETHQVIVEMSSGSGLLAAQWAIDSRIPLVAVLPWRNHDSNWPEPARQKLRYCLKRAAQVINPVQSIVQDFDTIPGSWYEEARNLVVRSAAKIVVILPVTCSTNTETAKSLIGSIKAADYVLIPGIPAGYSACAVVHRGYPGVELGLPYTRGGVSQGWRPPAWPPRATPAIEELGLA